MMGRSTEWLVSRFARTTGKTYFRCESSVVTACAAVWTGIGKEIHYFDNVRGLLLRLLQPLYRSLKSILLMVGEVASTAGAAVACSGTDEATSVGGAVATASSVFGEALMFSSELVALVETVGGTKVVFDTVC